MIEVGVCDFQDYIIEDFETFSLLSLGLGAQMEARCHITQVTLYRDPCGQEHLPKPIKELRPLANSHVTKPCWN